MSFNQEYEKITVQKKKGEYKEQVKCVCKTEIPSDEVKRIIAILPNARLIKTEQKEKVYLSNGTVNYYVCYVDSEGNFKKTEVRGEFTSNIKLDNEIVKTESEVIIDKTETDLSSINFTIYSYITIIVKGYCDCGFEAVKCGENLIANKKEIEYQQGLGIKTTQAPVEEQFELNYQISQVLTQQATTCVKQVQCGVNSIIVDGEVYLSAILLQSGEKESIIKENKTLEYRAEIECDDCSPEMMAKASAIVRSFKTDIAVDEQKNISQINASVILSLEGEAFKMEKCDIADDIFSITENLELIKGEGFINKECVEKTFFEEGRYSIPFEENDECTLIATTNEKVEVYSVNTQSDYLVVNGSITFNQVYQTENGYYSKKCETPFENKLDLFLGVNSEYQVKATVCKLSSTSKTKSEIEFSVGLNFVVLATSKQPVQYIKEVKSNGEKKQETSSLSVFIPTNGEDLWTLSKHLNICPEELLKTNKDLNFPLSGDERIVVFRQRKKENKV